MLELLFEQHLVIYRKFKFKVFNLESMDRLHVYWYLSTPAAADTSFDIQ